MNNVVVGNLVGNPRELSSTLPNIINLTLLATNVINNIVSSLTTVASADFNNTEISCRDGSIIDQQNADKQQATGMVYGELVGICIMPVLRRIKIRSVTCLFKLCIFT